MKIYIYIREYSKPYYYRVLGSTMSGCSEDARACVHYTFYIWLEWLCTLFAYVIRFFQMERDIYVNIRIYTFIYIYHKVRVTGERNFSEIQKSNPRRRDNSIRKKAKQKPRRANRMSTAHIRMWLSKESVLSNEQ